MEGYPELRSFLISDVRPTGRIIGAGSYGSVEEVAIPGAICAVKLIHHVLAVNDDCDETRHRFVGECRLMSTLRHPNVVQFLGVCILPDSPMPGILMERLATSLHDLLVPETGTPRLPDAPNPFFPLSLKCSILHNVASGLTYLHEHSPPIIHRDLTARNVLLNSGMVAKIADLGTARILPDARLSALTQGPGNMTYMPPEACYNISSSDRERDQRQLRYDTSIDIFSFGVVTLFTLTQTFPYNLLAPNYIRDGTLRARTELERREEYVTLLARELPQNHPLLWLVENCLNNIPNTRPNVHQVLRVLDQASAEAEDDLIGQNKLEMMRVLHEHASNQGSQGEELRSLRRQLQQQSHTHQNAVATMEGSLRQERQTIENREGELSSLQARFKEVSQQLHSERQLTETKNREIHRLDGITEDRNRELRQLISTKNRERFDAQRVIEEKERELQQKVTICESLEAELFEKEKEISELRKTLSMKEIELTELHEQQYQQETTAGRKVSQPPQSDSPQDGPQHQTTTTLEGAEFLSIKRQLQQLDHNYYEVFDTMEREICQGREAIENKEVELDTLRARLKETSQELHKERQQIESKNRQIYHVESTMEEIDGELRRLAEMKKRENLEAQNIIDEKERQLQQNISICEGLEAELVEKEAEIHELQKTLREEREFAEVSRDQQQQRRQRKQNTLEPESEAIAGPPQQTPSTNTTERRSAGPSQARRGSKMKRNVPDSRFRLEPRQTQAPEDETDPGELKEKDAMNMLCGVAHKWRQLGNQFGLQSNDLASIKMSHSVPMEWLLDVIATKKARTTNFGWRDIVKALRAIGENSVADRICHKYSIPLSPLHPADGPADVVVLRLKESSEYKLKVKFGALITFAIRILEKREEKCFEDFKSHVITVFSLDSAILEAKSYRQVFNQIGHEKKWDCVNYVPLVEILSHFIGEESEGMCSDYQHAVTAYHYATEKLTQTMSRTNLTKMCHENEPLDLTVREIEMKLHPHKVSERSLSYIYSVWDSMSLFFSIPAVKTVVDCMPSVDTEADCLCATLPPRTSEPLIGQDEQSWKKFMEENNIMEILLDSGHVFTV